jgi:hypothetical protein
MALIHPRRLPAHTLQGGFAHELVLLEMLRWGCPTVSCCEGLAYPRECIIDGRWHQININAASFFALVSAT